MQHEPSVEQQARRGIPSPAEILRQLRLLTLQRDSSKPTGYAARGALRLLVLASVLEDDRLAPELRRDLEQRMEGALAALDGIADSHTGVRDVVLGLVAWAAGWLREHVWYREPSDSVSELRRRPATDRPLPHARAVQSQATTLAMAVRERFADRFPRWPDQPDQELVVAAILGHLNKGGRGDKNRVESKDRALARLFLQMGLPAVDRPRRTGARKNRGDS